MAMNDYNNSNKHELFFDEMLIAHGRNTAERSKRRTNGKQNYFIASNDWRGL